MAEAEGGSVVSSRASDRPPVILTIGHSTRSLEEFFAILDTHGVEHLVDVRKIPRSRHNPQFNSDRLAAALSRVGVVYRHEPALGGLRHARADSPNGGWRNASFRGFADYMQTPEFAAALETLRETAGASTAIMCAEAVPWRCHRSLIADALSAQGIRVEHILSATHAEPHRLTPFATVQGTRVIYPPTRRSRGADPSPTTRRARQLELPE
jgi:uncharacterized protein (DUF488 family)